MATIYFREDFFSSALHEIAHWCIAGKERLAMVDYGYWYKPDGRSAKEQEEFLLVESKPQSLEWIFTSAASRPFFVSMDNLNGKNNDTTEFKKLVRLNALRFIENGLPPRASKFANELIKKYSSVKNFQEFWNRVRRDNILPL